MLIYLYTLVTVIIECFLQLIDEARRTTTVDFVEQVVKFFTADVSEKLLNNVNVGNGKEFVVEAKATNVQSRCFFHIGFCNKFKLPAWE